MTRQQLVAAALGLLLFLGLALSSVPARFAAHYIDRDTLALSGVRGSIWSGSAARAIVATPVGPLQLGELRWRVHPLTLLLLSPQLTVDSKWGSQRIASRVRRRGSRWEFRDVDANLDARLMQQLLPVELRGRISIQLDSASADPQTRSFSADGRVVWQNAVWQANSSSIPLGSYVALLSSEGDDDVTAQIETLSGSVAANGEMRIGSGRYAVDTRIDLPADANPRLSRALSLVAEPRENGYLLRLDGDIAANP